MERIGRAIAISVSLAAAGLVGPPVARSEAALDACRATTLLAVEACRAQARSARLVAVATCENAGAPDERKACRARAAADAEDAVATCRDERAVRRSACDRLGPGAYDPVIDPAKFPASPRVDNPFFPLTPGTTYVYEGQTSQGFEHDEFAVTHRTKVILGVTCIEVHDSVVLDGELAEDTLDWFAQDADGNVWYFGEHTMELAGGLATTLAGTFVAGVDRAKPGIVMEAHPAVGDFYRQEFDLRNAEDFAEVVSLDESFAVPCGTAQGCPGTGAYDHVLMTAESTPLEPDLHERKLYARNVGNIATLDANTGEKTLLVRILSE